ncbi:hypothetical protein R1flu_009384 [Riccia fluitans]|uniref:Uncharacterized protein n=1 Tax=Riccia fluitans TaxID=41844 RepID=A0ABD1Z4Y9_9MARC
MPGLLSSQGLGFKLSPKIPFLIGVYLTCGRTLGKSFEISNQFSEYWGVNSDGSEHVCLLCIAASECG